jgi:hypothetical protein
MPEQRPRSWHLQPDIANLAPESFTAQKLVSIRELCNRSSTDEHSNMLRQSTSTSPRGASSSGPSLYASSTPSTSGSTALTHDQRQLG